MNFFQITDYAGRMLHSAPFPKDGKIDLPVLDPGVYIISLSRNNQRIMKRFIKSN
ncbi:MAG: T9SS type A sorting domain-containing protein [Flavobacteriales bacterium]